MKCLAIDDEPLALELLEDNIRKIPFLEYAGGCRNALEAMAMMEKEKVDLLFLDIQMPGLTGIQFLQGMLHPPMVIFITAYEQYALEGFNLAVVDYLLKPVSFERFLKAVNKAHEMHRLRKNDAASEPPETDTNAPNKYLFVHSDYSLVKIRIADITHIEGLKDYVKIHLLSQSKPMIVRLTLKSIEDKLSSEDFIRVHKSYIVSFDKIELIRNQKIKIGNTFVPISDFYSEAFFSRIHPGRID
jgi:DNA-binding LytR/AlgR family response regulator